VVTIGLTAIIAAPIPVVLDSHGTTGPSADSWVASPF
jgi:hypothetical protein